MLRRLAVYREQSILFALFLSSFFLSASHARRRRDGFIPKEEEEEEEKEEEEEEKEKEKE